MNGLPDKHDLCIVFTTMPDLTQAELLAEQLVKRKLASCVNIVPSVSSIYSWEGKIVRSKEVQLMLKTDLRLLTKIESYFTKHHPYDVPELISCNISGGSASYMDWLTASLK